MNSPLVSVIVPTFNNAKLIAFTLESILGQSYVPIELIVVNDGSTDDTLAVLDRFKEHENLRVICQPNGGDIVARNTGIEACRGDLVAFCDSDDVWEPEHVHSLVDQLTRFPETGMVFDNVSYFSIPDGVDENPFNAPVDEGLLIDRARARKMALQPVSLQEMVVDNLTTTSAFMVRKAVFSKVGVFDRDIYLMNDLHIFYRICACYPIRFVDRVGVRKRVHPRSLSMVNAHYEYGVYCLENIRERYANVYEMIGRRVFNQKLGSKYYRLGAHYERQGQLQRAKEMYRKAFSTRKFNLRYYWEYARASLKS